MDSADGEYAVQFGAGVQIADAPRLACQLEAVVLPPFVVPIGGHFVAEAPGVSWLHGSVGVTGRWHDSSVLVGFAGLPELVRSDRGGE